MKFKERLYRFMYGRYGGDDLSKFILGVIIALAVISIFVTNPIARILIYLIYVALLVWDFFRMFSKNIYKRQKENAVYMRLKNKVVEWFKYLSNKWKYRKTHVYKKCPTCKSKLRLMRKKGSHTVKCPKCSNNFSVKIR